MNIYKDTCIPEMMLDTGIIQLIVRPDSIGDILPTCMALWP